MITDDSVNILEGKLIIDFSTDGQCLLVGNVDEFDYQKLNPGIRETVKWLHQYGFNTSDSSDGVSNIELGMEGAPGIPMVAINSSAKNMVAESHLLYKLLLAEGIDFSDSAHMPSIEVIYSPIDEYANIMLYNVNDTLLFVNTKKNITNE